MKFEPEDIVAIILSLIVVLQMMVISVARFKGMEINADMNKEIMIFILGALAAYIAKKKTS